MILDRIGVFLLTLTTTFSVQAQSFDVLPLSNLSAFQAADKNWQIVGAVSADLQKDYSLKTEKGSGILVNLPGDKSKSNLVTVMEHGDIDLELEFMMARHSNSGIYLQGRYELQLLDSWGVQQPRFSDCGGIYERWDEAQPEGQKGYEGYAPRINACKAPGLWNKLEISFQAPRFDQYGNKTANARLMLVKLNGAIIHENLELTGPTRGGGNTEAALGPILIQGDHGPVAFRNIRYQIFDQPPVTLSQIRYEYYLTEKDDMVLSGLSPLKTGSTDKLTHEVVSANEKLSLRFTGNITIPKSGTYQWMFYTFGWGKLRIGDTWVFPRGPWDRKTTVALEAGTYPFELVYTKTGNWFLNGLGLFVAGPGIRYQALHTESSLPPGIQAADPILLEKTASPYLLRSFVDFQTTGDSISHRISHAINVGNPEGLHFSYNLENGALFQVWKGPFLDATPMWNDRGDGSSRAMGVVIPLWDEPLLAVLSGQQATWSATYAASDGFRSKGYALNDVGYPIFQYQTLGLLVKDELSPVDGGKALSRKIGVQGTTTPAMYLRIAKGTDIRQVDAQTYAIDQAYYLKVPSKPNFKVELRSVLGVQELLIPMHQISQIEYEMIW
ncbi:MAG TPA: DUF1080 domain-containing protein [Saprospiraceae bacterium]|nr:DUF1080 domain-containing protein [Saprospiraceae bacterium]HMQ84039.1 DUF1080 domain-containing protein [Saprospiraceae bacterium]